MGNTVSSALTEAVHYAVQANGFQFTAIVLSADHCTAVHRKHSGAAVAFMETKPGKLYQSNFAAFQSLSAIAVFKRNG